MTQEASFLHAVLENPEDDATRLIFADWLDDNGQPERAEFIRLQVEGARLPLDAEGQKERRKRNCPAEPQRGGPSTTVKHCLASAAAAPSSIWA